MHFQFELHFFYTSLMKCFKFAKGLEAPWHKSHSQEGRAHGPSWERECRAWAGWTSVELHMRLGFNVPKVKDSQEKFLCIRDLNQWKLVSSEKSLMRWINLRIAIGRSILCIAAYHVIPNILENHFRVHAAGRPLHKDSRNTIRCIVWSVNGVYTSITLNKYHNSSLDKLWAD